MKKLFVCLISLVALVICTTGCITKNNVVTRGTNVGPGGTNTFEHTDRSWSVNQLGSSVGNDGTIFRFRASVGGGVPVGNQYGYGGGYGYHSGGTYVQGLAGLPPMNGWPAVVVPSEVQVPLMQNTAEAYGYQW